MCVLIITDDCDNMTSNNCTNNENIIDIITPALLLTISYGLSFFCLMSLMVYTLIKHLIRKNIYLKKFLLYKYVLAL